MATASPDAPAPATPGPAVDGRSRASRYPDAVARGYPDAVARVTNRVEPTTLGDLLASPCRATLAWEGEGQLELAPARYAFRRGRHCLAAPRGGPAPGPGARASLVVDDGGSWFALRAVTLRGVLAAAPDPPPSDERWGPWLELVPARATAWDYGALHREPDA